MFPPSSGFEELHADFTSFPALLPGGLEQKVSGIVSVGPEEF